MKKAKHNVKTVIREAMKKVRKNRKLKITNQFWGCRMDDQKGYFVPDSSKKVCAMGALLVHKNGSIKFDEFRGKRPLNQLEIDEVAAYVLGVDLDWVSTFITGFDNPCDSPEKQGYKLGKKATANQKEAARAFRIGQELAKEFKLVPEDENAENADGDWCNCNSCVEKHSYSRL